MKPGEQDRLRSGIGSRPTSDTDDAVWEELLQGPDSASTGSSGSDNSRGCSDGLVLPPMNTLSSDDDSRPQETSRVRCLLVFFFFYSSYYTPTSGCCSLFKQNDP